MTQTPPPSLEWCLFLDVDGTLIELTDSPFDTCADAELKALLSEVAERLGGAVALVSGRSIEYLDALFAPLRLPAAGLHGVERRKASGVMHGASFEDSQLDPARVALKTLVDTVKPRGFTKGSAIGAFMREPPFSGRKPVFVGDDLTDLDGFKAVEDQRGISIAVGDRVPARYRIENVAAVRGWLKAIAALHDSHL